VQGKLRAEPLSFVIRTECAESRRPLRIEIDSNLDLQHVSVGAEPFIFAPAVNLDKIKQDNIVDVF